MKVFVDANIFLDNYYNRRDALLPIGEFAFNFFKETFQCKFEIVVCKEVVGEVAVILDKDYEKTFSLVFAGLLCRRKLSLVDATQKQKSLAFELSKKRHVPYSDALYGIISQELRIPIVTRDNHFFDELVELIEAFKPENLP